ncbi:hypothetical protein [Streptomyces sp. NPDC056296]|uniref:hypothetical protein n=1 Tax=Streptomyces sp. NPDC056296 TaxID=3345775 RepID=UPI0035E214E3
MTYARTGSAAGDRADDRGGAGGRWPTGAEKVELIHGVMVFAGHFDERDLDTARRTYPGRRPVINADGGLEIHPAGPGRPAPLLGDPHHC